MSDSRCFFNLLPWIEPRIDLNLYNCRRLHDMHNQGYLQEARSLRTRWQENCIKMVIGKKLEAPNSSYSHFIDFKRGSDFPSIFK